MPIAELLGVQFDMQLLLRMSVSVAAVLLVGWAYRFYSSRNVRKICTEANKGAQNATCQSCKTTLRCGCSPRHHTDEEVERHTASNTHSTSDGLTSDSTKKAPAEGRPRRESGTPGTTGRRSPCFLQKLEGFVGVGRELRQDLEHQGAYSSFRSKAEIKVEDANVVLDGTGDQIVRGKIYDYYVESSSHSITDSNAALGQFERKSESQTAELGDHSSPSSLSPIIMRDLVLPQSPVEDASSLGSLKLRHPERPVLLRKESYLSATEQSELTSHSLTSTASTPVIYPLTSTSSESRSLCPVACPSTGGPNVRRGADLETGAGAPFLHLPAKSLDSTDVESLMSKLDLGNCLETLYLAKKYGQTSLQQAALGIMSDNYLQVLRDPNLYGRLMAGEREKIQKQRLGGRKFIVVADMDPQDWARNTATQKRTSSALYYYDDYKDSWHTLCLIPQEVISKACAMCTMDNYLFVALGCQVTDREMTPSKRVFCYNPLTSIWKEISSMNEARPSCKLAALEGYIYAIGGECLSSVERYDPRLDRWTFVAPLPDETFAVAHHVTVCNGEIFVSGGTLRYMLQRYSPKTDTWRPTLLVSSKDRTADMVAVRRFLYRFDVNPLLGVSVYRYHTVARLWYECSQKRLQHCPTFQCVTMDDAIYCISRQFTMRFKADEISPAFTDEDLSVLSSVKGILFPFVLSLPDKKPRQTSV
ncbi:kelch domain-containing protein 7A [Echeneis naucrates]|uniref:kelch domain-containing protein 7A n=1 Tax=Echeneis naucrates TaxID=173247 RepID=UPI001113D6D7|nr:kelch domain-containing protein 7A [Echeneis naucrates]